MPVTHKEQESVRAKIDITDDGSIDVGIFRTAEIEDYEHYPNYDELVKKTGRQKNRQTKILV